MTSKHWEVSIPKSISSKNEGNYFSAIIVEGNWDSYNEISAVNSLSSIGPSAQ